MLHLSFYILMGVFVNGGSKRANINCYYDGMFFWSYISLDYAFAYAICYYQNVVLSISLAVLIGLLIFGNAATRVIVLIIVALSLISSLFNIKPTSMEMAEKAVSCKK